MNTNPDPKFCVYKLLYFGENQKHPKKFACSDFSYQQKLKKYKKLIRWLRKFTKGENFKNQISKTISKEKT